MEGEKRTMRARASNLFYACIRALVEGVCRLFFRVKIEGKEHIPKTGAFVLAPVHRSNVDFAIAACTTRRRMRFMAKDSLWRGPPPRPFINVLGAHPVKRGPPARGGPPPPPEGNDPRGPRGFFPPGTPPPRPVL